MSADDTPLPTPTYKAGWVAEVIDEKSPHCGEIGDVIATATTREYSVVSLRLRTAPVAKSLWYRADQLKRVMT